MLLGIIFAFSLLLANLIWEDTSEVLVINELNENTDYLATVSSYLPGLNQHIAQYLPSDDLVESIDVSIFSVAVFNGQDKHPAYQYFPIDEQLANNENVTATNIVDFSNAIVANLDSMKQLSNIFNLNGTIPTQENEFMISSILAEDLSELYQKPIGAGSHLNISIGRRFPETDAGEVTISAFRLKHFQDFKITGVIDYNGASSILEKLYFEDNLKRLTVFPFTNNTLAVEDLREMDTNSMIADLMVNFSPERLLNAGIEGLDDLVKDFMERIRSRFWYSSGTTQTRTINDLQEEFRFSFNSSLLYYPLIILSLLLSHYTIGLLLKGRNNQFELLKLRGATDWDISKLLTLEFLFIALMGIVIGTPIAIIFAAFIPGLRDDGSIDREIVIDFFRNMQLEKNISEIYQIELTVLGVFFASAIFHLVTNILDLHNEVEDFHRRFIYVARVITTILFSSLLIALIIQIREELTLSLTSFDRSLEDRLSRIIIIMVVVWLLLSQFIADFSVWLLNRAVLKFNKVKPSTSFFISKNLSRKKSLSKLFAFYLIFLFSIAIFCSTLYSTYNTYDVQSEIFTQGADLRIHTSNVYHNFADNISSIPGISEVTPVYSSIGFIGTTIITVYAVDPETYPKIGYWNNAQGLGDPKDQVNYLQDNPSSVIISGEISSRLGMDINETLHLRSYEGEFLTRLNITGIIDSAPGLGLAGFHNPELNHYSTGWMLVSINWVIENFDLIGNRHETDLFFASLEDGVNMEDVEEQLADLEAIDLINPRPINRNFIGVFVFKFLPSPQAIVRFGTLISVIISFVMTFLMTGYMLESRKKEYALMIAVGAKRKQVNNLIFGEISLLTFASLLVAGLYGYLITKLSLFFFIPYTMKKLYFPITLDIQVGSLLFITSIYFIEVLIVIAINRRRILSKEIMGILLDRGS